MEFRDLINSSLAEARSHSKEARFSFLQGGYVEDFDTQGSTTILEETDIIRNNPNPCLFFCKRLYISVKFAH